MNQLITFDEAAGYLKNSPLLAPRPNIPKIRALCKHITQALKQLDCPQSMIHGWAGLVMDPTIYTLMKVAAFVMPPAPGNLPVYQQFATVQMIKMADHVWENARIFFLSYVNISHACFQMLNELVLGHFKVSNNPNLLGWNPRMSVQLILAQLKLSYGKLMPTILWNNNKLFTADFLPTKAPKMLFHRIEQCQEVVIVAENLYTQTQLVSNMMHLLLKSGIFLMCKFEDWEAVPNKK